MPTALQPQPTLLQLINQELLRDPKLQSANTRRSYSGDLKHFVEWLGPRQMTRLLVEQYTVRLQRREYTPASINRKLSAIRWWAGRVEAITDESPLPSEKKQAVTEHAQRIQKVDSVTGSREKRGRHITPDEMAALMRACAADASPAGRRDAALLALGYFTGMRVSELAALTTAQIKPAEIRLVGKGNKHRKLPLHSEALAYLAAWLRVRPGPGYVFCPVTKTGTFLLRRRAATESLSQWLFRRVKEAAIPPATWHDFRRTFAGELLSTGADLVTVQAILGHAKPETTASYDRRGDETRSEAVGRLAIPK